VSNQSAGLRDIGSQRPFAFQDAAMSGLLSVLCRRIPSVSRSAPGAPALRPQVFSKCARAKAVWRLSMQETARASWCAKILQAVPLSGFFSTLARDFCPGSCPRRHRGAAAAKAHCRCALPLLVPAVPRRFPPDALAPLTRRPDDAQSCPRGQRSMSWIASSKTRLRMLPMPGTVCKRERVWASWCFAVLRRKSSRSLRS
jgi:hypothetical protein